MGDRKLPTSLNSDEDWAKLIEWIPDGYEIVIPKRGHPYLRRKLNIK